MKKLSLLSVFCLITFLTCGQSKIQGVFIQQDGDTSTQWLFVDGYCSQTTYQQDKYISTQGGPFIYENGKLSVRIEYSDKTSSEVGKQHNFPLTLDGANLKEESGKIWKAAKAKPQALDGNWRITARKQGKTMSEIPNGDRKTIKLLIDGYFQWIAINPAEKGFYGTGGGHYTFSDGKYSEHIAFFSRDNTRVGAELTFEGEIKGGKWHHSGLSSVGDPIHEIWTRETR